jgi:hypothetical protein
MQTRKQWLLSEGHIEAAQAGRGRISRENQALIEKAFESGTRFSDWEPKVTEKPDGSTVTENSISTRTGPKSVSDFTILWPEDEFQAIELHTKKVRSMREACQCKRSLVQCECDRLDRVPHIVATDGRGTVPIQILRKK